MKQHKEDYDNKMSKALVIKGANFSVNKVETITITEVIPCTDISLSQSTISFTSIGETVQLTMTKTPADTTEAVTWQSSNTNVATVENGTVTCVGIGSCTITATCGTVNDTCSASLNSVTVDFSQYQKMENYKTSYNRDYATLTAKDFSYVYISASNILDGYKAFYGSSELGESRFPIPIPNGATRVSVSCNNSNLWIDMLFFDSQTPSQNRPSSSATYSATRTGLKSGQGSYADYDFSAITTDSYVISVTRSAAESTDLEATITVVFS